MPGCAWALVSEDRPAAFTVAANPPATAAPLRNSRRPSPMLSIRVLLSGGQEPVGVSPLVDDRPRTVWCSASSAGFAGATSSLSLGGGSEGGRSPPPSSLTPHQLEELARPRLPGALQDLLRRPVLDDPPVGHEPDPAGALAREA